jgi:hypothetical protein
MQTKILVIRWFAACSYSFVLSWHDTFAYIPLTVHYDFVFFVSSLVPADFGFFFSISTISIEILHKASISSFDVEFSSSTLSSGTDF